MELIATPGNPTPGHAVVTRVVTEDGKALRAARWRPTTRRIKGTVLILQGRAEFIEKYFETIADLRRRGFAVAAFDWRGQGGSVRELSNARKGHVDDFSSYELDLEATMTHVVAEHCPPPFYGLAHSMGAAILFHALRNGQTGFERVVALAPMVRIAFVKAPRLARVFAEVLDGFGFGGSFIPGGCETSISTKPFPGNRLCTDPVRYARNALVATTAPHLAIGDPTIAWTDAAFRCMAEFEDPRLAAAIQTPALVVAAGDDPVVSTRMVERFAARLKSGRAIIVPGARHEILMERTPIRELFWAAFDAFIPGTAPVEAKSTTEAL